MMFLLLQILIFVVVLSFLVLIHELGHFFAARKFGVVVEEFGLGYPPLAKVLFKKFGTTFTLNWIPFGGFVRLKGENGPEEAGAATVRTKTADAFYMKPKLPRLAILLAGVAVNLVFGVLAFSAYYSTQGIPEVMNKPIITEVAVNSPAAQGGLQAQTLVYGFDVDGAYVTTSTQDEVLKFVKAHQGQKVTIHTSGPCQETTCEDSISQSDVYIRKPEETPENQGALGVAFVTKISPRFYPWYQMPVRGTLVGLQQSGYLIQLILDGLAKLVVGASHGQVPSDVAGPVGIFEDARKGGVLSGNPWDALNFAGILSINLAVMNLLPIPALDGGRALFIGFEALLGKKKVAKVEGYLNYATFAMLLGLTVLITIRDISRLMK